MGSPPYIRFRLKTRCVNRSCSRGPGGPHMVGGDFSVCVPSSSVEMGVGRAEPDDGYRSGDLVRIRDADAFGACRPRRFRRGEIPRNLWHLAVDAGSDHLRHCRDHCRPRYEILSIAGINGHVTGRGLAAGPAGGSLQPVHAPALNAKRSREAPPDTARANRPSHPLSE